MDILSDFRNKGWVKQLEYAEKGGNGGCNNSAQVVKTEMENEAGRHHIAALGL